MKTSDCRGCGRPMVWAVTPDGKKIPLDPKASVYRVTSNGPNEPPTAELVRTRQTVGDNDVVQEDSYMVSHFHTCPNASDFSGRSRRRPEGFQGRVVRK